MGYPIRSLTLLSVVFILTFWFLLIRYLLQRALHFCFPQKLFSLGRRVLSVP